MAAARAETEKAAINWLALRDDIAAYLATLSRDAWRSTFVPVMQGVIDDQAGHWSTILGTQFSVRNLYAERWFEAYILEFAQQVSQTTSDGISDLLAQAMREGWGTDTTTRRLRQVFRQWQAGDLAPGDFEWLDARMPVHRAATIARTETMRASNAGSLRLFREWGAEQKEWAAHLDHRVRDTHRAAHGQQRPVDEAFTVGGARMMHPLDSSLGAPIAEIVNCRCVVLPVIPGDEVPPEVPPDTAPPTPEEQAQRALEQVLAADQGFVDERALINREIGAAQDAYSAMVAEQYKARDSGDPVAYQAARANTQRASDALDAVYDRWSEMNRTLADRRRAAFTDILAAPGQPANLPINYFGGPMREPIRPPAGQRANVNAALAFVARLVGRGSGLDDLTTPIPVANHRALRAYSWQGGIYVRASESIKTIVHELGHVIEHHDKGILADNLTWRDKRTAGEPKRSLRTLTGDRGYEASEVAQPDRFLSPYVGKDYGARASEVLSMGLEYLYDDAAELARRDPDMFLAIVRVLRRWGGKG